MLIQNQVSLTEESLIQMTLILMMMLFLTFLGQAFGVLKESLCYILVHRDAVPNKFANAQEEHILQLPLLTGDAYQLNNHNIYRKLKAFLINSPGWAWIEPHDSAADGCTAFKAWMDHYNGEGKLSKHTAIVKTKLDQVHYKNKYSMSFEKCTKIMTRCFNMFHKDLNQHYLDHQKVEKLLKTIQCQETELMVVKSLIDQQFSCDFIGVCAFFLKQVTSVHGPAQLECKNLLTWQETWYLHHGQLFSACKLWMWSSWKQGTWQRRPWRSWRSWEYGTNHTINEIDILDPTHNFTAQEWDALGHGHAVVMQLHES